MKNSGIYIHIPFCVKKCNYCDFLSMSTSDDIKEKYLGALCEELKNKSGDFKDYNIDTVFIGGGTPSIFSVKAIDSLLDCLYKNYSVDRDAEITIEANPGTINYEKLLFYRESGINRLSMGLQSVDDEELKLLGRIHDLKTFEINYNEAIKAGFTNINFDIMSGLPGQTPKKWENNLLKALKYNANHMSVYGLIIEENTPFFDLYEEDEKRRLEGEATKILPCEKAERMMYKITNDVLSGHGYQRYEISNYAKEDFECAHNIKYWTGGEYIGFGIGAASLINNTRYKNHEDINTYINGEYIYESIDTLDQKAMMEEFMFLGLRMTRGVKCEDFHKRFCVSLESVYGDVLKKLVYQGLIKFEENAYTLTSKGIDVSNYVFSEFL